MWNRWHLIPLVSFMLLIASACGPAAVQPTLRPTVTPFSTPLPWINTPVAAGTASNPLRMVLIPADFEAAQERASDFETLLSASGVTVDLELAESQADVIRLLCENTSAEEAVVAWVDGLGYASARANLCGEAALMLSSDQTGDLHFGEQAQFIVNDEFGTESVGVLEGRTLCRLGYEDVISWLVPQLWFAQDAYDVAIIDDIEDVEDYAAIVTDVAAGRCAAGTVPASYIETLEDDEALSGVDLARISPPIPYGVLVVPPGLPAERRDPLVSVLVSAASNNERADLLAAFFGEYSIEAVDEEVLTAFNDFIAATGFNFSQASRS
ncbi:PhnD/SsuA/transferrin family substrate-binding protein [Phototrophicus methaneseepsis]|nr:PhnD/SsuA/transferrin family substrate-binding protein [Phototrophicus methaneseepsis]